MEQDSVTEHSGTPLSATCRVILGTFKQPGTSIDDFDNGMLPIIDNVVTALVSTGLCRSQNTVRRGGVAREQVLAPRGISKRI